MRNGNIPYATQIGYKSPPTRERPKLALGLIFVCRELCVQHLVASNKRDRIHCPKRLAHVLPENCKGFWPMDFLQRAKKNDERFCAFFAGLFWPKMQNGSNFVQKHSASSRQHSAKTRFFTAKDAEDAKEGEAKSTPF